MSTRIKLMSVMVKKPKKDSGWADVVERYAPGLYELLDGVGEADTLKKVEELRPEIVLILPSVLNEDIDFGLQLVKKIKQINPATAVFVNLNDVEDEQDVMEQFAECGAYKCYAMPTSMDALFHDMYVALNLE